MDELLNKLLAAEVLTEDTKADITATFNAKLEEAMTAARATATATVTAELNEQFIVERDTLIEALDSKVSEALAYELEELREDIERFRDLEAEYAERLVEAKSEMADVLKSDIAQLIENLDVFLEVRLTSELSELREDFEVVKKNEFGKSVFEAFVTEFKKHYAGDDSIEARLNETEARLDDALEALEETEKKAARLERSMKVEKVLAPLTGRTREVMEAILKNVDTPLLEEAYKTYVGRVLKEASEEVDTSGKENTVLAEGTKQKVVTGVTKKGNDDARIIQESVQDAQDAHSHYPTLSDAEKERLRRIAGV